MTELFHTAAATIPVPAGLQTRILAACRAEATPVDRTSKKIIPLALTATAAVAVAAVAITPLMNHLANEFGPDSPPSHSEPSTPAQSDPDSSYAQGGDQNACKIHHTIYHTISGDIGLLVDEATRAAFFERHRDDKEVSIIDFVEELNISEERLKQSCGITEENMDDLVDRHLPDGLTNREYLDAIYRYDPAHPDAAFLRSEENELDWEKTLYYGVFEEMTIEELEAYFGRAVLPTWMPDDLQLTNNGERYGIYRRDDAFVAANPREWAWQLKAKVTREQEVTHDVNEFFYYGKDNRSFTLSVATRPCPPAYGGNITRFKETVTLQGIPVRLAHYAPTSTNPIESYQAILVIDNIDYYFSCTNIPREDFLRIIDSLI